MRDLKANNQRVKTRANKRHKKKEPRNWGKLLRRLMRVSLFAGSAALVVFGGILAARLLLDWGYFQVDKVSIENNQRISTEEVLALSDIQPGVGIFDLDLERIGRKIEENPWIARAEVKRIFPGEVVIEVVERTPGAILSLGYLYYVDWDGEIFKLLGPSDSLDFPVITGVEKDDLLNGPDRIRQDLKTAMDLLRQIEVRRTFNLDDISEVNISKENGFDLMTYVGGVPVRLGHGNFYRKLDRLEKVYKELRPKLLALKYIDLNVTDRVIVRVATTMSVGKG